MYTVHPKTIPQIDDWMVAEEHISYPALMERAGEALAKTIAAYAPKNKPVLLLCGPGQNGGDGYAAASKLKGLGYSAVTVDLFPHVTTEGASKYHKENWLARQGNHIPLTPAELLSQGERIEGVGCVVDCVLGTGARFGLSSDLANLLDFMNALPTIRIAADMPTGIDALFGRADPHTFLAHHTVTFCAMKIGMLSQPAKSFCGHVTVATLGIPQDKLAQAFPPCATILDEQTACAMLPSRLPNTHKGTYGKVGLLCGSDTYIGAGVLATEGALRSGVGLTYLFSSPSVKDIVHLRMPECICADTPHLSAPETLAPLSAMSALVVGCGWEKTEANRELLLWLLKEDTHPIVIDAEGINLLAEDTEETKQILKNRTKSVIFTPHPLEFTRLFGGDVETVQNNRIEATKAAAKAFHATVLLKGDASVLVDHTGAYTINTTGSTSLSKGGSGDVLAGLIGGFLAEGLSAFDAAALATYLHGKAGEHLSSLYSPYGARVSDLPAAIASVLATIYNS